MKIATSKLIKEIDAYAENTLGIPTHKLMKRAGEAVADSVLRVNREKGAVLVLSGGGNNGGDGYAAALELYPLCEVRVIDLFSKGQRSEAGKHFLSECEKLGIVSRGFDKAYEFLEKSTVIVDAIFGIGYSGEPRDELSSLSTAIASLGKRVVAVDIPLGIIADTGEVCRGAMKADITVALSGYKPAHLSYPARGYMGEVCLYDLGLSKEIAEFPSFGKYIAADFDFAKDALPKRGALTNKGSYGHTLHITGSDKYVGAAMLSLEASLRSGIGLVSHLGERELQRELRARFPEVIYTDMRELHLPSDIIEYSRKYSSILVGPGSSVSEKLFLLIKALVESDGAPLIIDADGLNSISEFSDAELFKAARRTVIITPHPREMSRLSGESTEYINAHRLPFAESFAKQYGVVLLLKGAATVITDGDKTIINTTGSSALAKGGSGDVLAGIISSLVPNVPSPLFATALGAYLHGRAADALSGELSEFGVTPSDLPLAVAKEINAIIKP